MADNTVERKEVLAGCTYKIQPPTLDASIYITINDHEVDGQMRPFEIFFNSKHVDSYEWATCTSRMLSALFRQPGAFPQFAIEEMMQTHSPRGGYIIPKSQGKSAVSIVAHIGLVIKEHCQRLGIWQEKDLTKK